MKSILPFTFLFAIICIVEIFAAVTGYTTLVYVFKPAIVISLLAFSLWCLKKTKFGSKTIFMSGLCFALLGDIFLMIREKDLFIPGLGSFLVMQWLYVFTFHADIKDSPSKPYYLKYYLPFLIFALLLFFILLPNLPDLTMRFAVGVYAFSIATMAWMAFLRRGFVSPISFQYVFTGAILFMISDSLIAVDRFLFDIPFNSIWVMSTYVIAQYLIVIGIIKKQTET